MAELDVVVETRRRRHVAEILAALAERQLQGPPFEQHGHLRRGESAIFATKTLASVATSRMFGRPLLSRPETGRECRYC